MVEFPVWFAMNAFTSAVLLVLSGALVVAGRRRGESLLLAVFLGLVGVNYLGVAFGTAHDGVGGSLVLGVAAFGALALDPFYLLAFVTLYPFPRRTRATKVLLATSGALSIVSLAIVVLAPERILAGFLPGASYTSPWRFPTLANLVLAYGASWFFAVQAVRDAPSPSLSRRSGWLVVAVGVATLPRLGYLPGDFGLPLPRAGFTDIAAVDWALLPLLLHVTLAALAFGLASRVAYRKRHIPRSVWLAGGAALGIFGLEIASTFGEHVFQQRMASAVPFAVRWQIFAAILVYGILAYDVVDFRRFVHRAAVPVGALLGGIGALVIAYSATAPALVLALATLAGAPFGAIAARAGATRVSARETEGLSRRLELYRAALEAAWARGAPDADARRLLERDRRAFGVSAEEARALEHVVSRPAFARASSLEAGFEIGPGIVIDREIGAGAHGRVFLAARHSQGDRVVVKVLRGDEEDGRENRRRLLAELRALDGLTHPNIVKLLDVLTIEGRHVLVMEHVEGRSLESALADGRLSAQAAQRVLLDILAGLEAVHARGVVHRDVKPANVMLSANGRGVVADFGVADWGGSARVRATMESFASLGSIVGTLQYMAPEQARGETATPATDVYAVGLIAFECLARKPALDLRGLSAPRALARVASPSIDWSRTPSRWKPVLKRSLAPDPKDRFASAREMAEAVASLATAV